MTAPVEREVVVSHPVAVTRPPKWLFALELGYLFVLFAIFIADEESGWFHSQIPSKLGQLPTAAVWFGSVGAVLISLTGIFLHSRDWNDRYNEWHIARPFLGAVIGPLGCLILIVIVNAANNRGTAPNATFFYVTAFLVGYREETFRSLIKRGTDVVLGNQAGKSGEGRK